MLEHVSIIAMYCFSAIVWVISGMGIADKLTLWKISIPGIRWVENTRRLDIIFLISGIAFIWIARLPTLQFALPLDPDEGQFAANAMRIWAGGMDWGNFALMSTGPLDSIVLIWPCLIGLDVTLTTTRIMGTAIICAMLVILFLCIRRLSSTKIAVLSSFPLFIFYASVTNVHFIHYSSEHLPMLLIFVGIYGFIHITGDNPVENKLLGILLLSAFCLGMVPFAKLQAAPLAAWVGLALIIRIFSLVSKRKWRDVLLVTCAALAPSVMFLLPMLFRGEFHNFMNSCIIKALNYVLTPLSPKDFLKLSRVNVFYWDVFCIYAAMLVISVGLSCFSTGTYTTARKWAGGLSFWAISAAYFCIVRSGHVFPHYLHFMLPPLALSAGVFYAIGSDAFLVRMRSARLQVAMHILVCSAMIFLIIPEAKSEIKNNLAYQFGGFSNGLTFKSPRLMQWLKTKKSDTLFIWGWMPHWYLSTGMSPAVRGETVTNKLITPWPLRDFFRDRLLQDFNRRQPDFVIDAVAPDSFFYNDPGTQSILSFPALTEIMKDSYARLSGDDPKGTCPRLYVRKERLAEILRNVVPISRISASGQYSKDYGPEHVYDCNVLEFSNVFSDETCIDYWLLPDASTGFITLEFASSRVGSVSILNTRNGNYGDRATERVRIITFRDETVLDQHELTLNPYPYWTDYKLPEPVDPADGVRIEILSFIGRGAGLNEIKIYRE